MSSVSRTMKYEPEDQGLKKAMRRSFKLPNRRVVVSVFKDRTLRIDTKSLIDGKVMEFSYALSEEAANCAIQGYLMCCEC